MKKWIIGIIVLLTLGISCGGWHVAAQWWMLRKVFQHPEARHRASIIPTEIDLSSVQVAQCVTCSVGYAEFVIPFAGSVTLKSSGSGLVVLGESESLCFALLPPHDPSALNMTADSFKKEVCKLPPGHSLREQLAKPGATFLDLDIAMERALPSPYWKAAFQDRSCFTFNTIQLALKASCTGAGMSSVHTFHTPEIRGLIRIGKSAGDSRNAHVSIENRLGTQSVGMYFSLPSGREGSIRDVLLPVLATFRFTVEHLDANDKIKESIMKAGIKPRIEEHEIKNVQQGQSG